MNNEVKIIAIVGMPGSGKTFAADFFRSKGIPVLRFGDATDEGLKELGLERNEKNERFVREKLRREFGMPAMAIKIEPRIEEAMKTAQVIILDGLYSWEEYVYLKDKFSHLFLLCIYAEPPIRYERLQRRPVRPLTIEEARSRDIAEIEGLNKGGPIAIADYLIKNDKDEEEYARQLEYFYTKYVKGDL
ncbi:MAG: AAA family ATPase [Patescibacteria group bacterium]|nr:AAA family ATPase [Patescibacteria group bacterium]